jgi:hypothetical protein
MGIEPMSEVWQALLSLHAECAQVKPSFHCDIELR